MSEATIYLSIGVFALVLFALQTLMTLLGGDGHDGQSDFDHGGLDHGGIDHGDSHQDGGTDEAHGEHQEHPSLAFLRFFTLRNLIAFAMGYGWVGYASLQTGLSSLLALVLGVICGVLLVLVIYKLMRVLYKLESDGTTKMSEAVGQIGEVYLEIDDHSPGKILVLVRGVKREFPAVNYQGGRLEKGAKVRILDYDGSFFAVEQI